MLPSSHATLGIGSRFAAGVGKVPDLLAVRDFSL